jgi:hypothetical protein
MYASFYAAPKVLKALLNLGAHAAAITPCSLYTVLMFSVMGGV